MKLSEAFANYRKYEITAMGYSSNTYRSYLSAEKAAIGFFGDINTATITVDLVHEFFISSTKIRSIDSTRAYISKLRSVLRFCETRGERTINPELIRIPRCEKKVARFITCEEFGVFLREMARKGKGYKEIDRIRNVIITELLFITGLRVSELCALNRDSFKDRQAVIVGKSKLPRPCYITKPMEKKIQDYLSMRKDTNRALFIDNVTKKRITPHSIQRIFRRVSKSSGIYSVTPHTLRHSYATRMLEDGVDIRFVAELLGHQSLSTTQKYTHIKNAKLKEIYDNVLDRHIDFLAVQVYNQRRL